MTVLSLDLRLDFPGFRLNLAHDEPLGAVTALFGPSGCGKSSLLRVIAGLETRALGRVAFGETLWQGGGAAPVPPWQRDIGYVFQDTRLFPHLTVRGNLDYAARRAPRNGTGIAFDQVVAALGLEPLLSRSTPELSGGERQRVAIGRTLLTRPRLLLMDEPLAALDYRRRADLLGLIAQLPKTFGVPILYVTHAIDEVANLADRMIVLREGRLETAGPVSEVFSRLDLGPLTGRFEAGAVIEARVRTHDARWKLTRLDVEGQTLTMPHLDAPEGAVVRVRIRARDVSISRTRPEGLSIRNALAARIDSILEEPDTAFAELRLSVGPQKLRARLTREAVHDLALTEGQHVFALVKSVSFDRRMLGRPTG